MSLEKNDIHECKFNDWTVGDINEAGSLIEHIYYRKRGSFIIYKSNKSSLVSHTLAEGSNLEDKLTSISELISEVHHLLPKEYKNRDRFLYRIASSKKLCFYDQSEAAINVLTKVIYAIKNQKLFESRIRYIGGAIGFSLIVLILCLVLNKNFEVIVGTDNISLFNVMIFSCLGGILSTLKNAKILDLDIESDSYIFHIINGISRITIAIIAGIISLYAIDSRIIFDSLLQKINTESIYYLIATIAGFSESFIPNLMNRLEKKDNLDK